VESLARKGRASETVMSPTESERRNLANGAAIAPSDTHLLKNSTNSANIIIYVSIILKRARRTFRVSEEGKEGEKLGRLACFDSGEEIDESLQ